MFAPVVIDMPPEMPEWVVESIHLLNELESREPFGILEDSPMFQGLRVKDKPSEYRDPFVISEVSDREG